MEGSFAVRAVCRGKGVGKPTRSFSAVARHGAEKGAQGAPDPA